MSAFKISFQLLNSNREMNGACASADKWQQIAYRQRQSYVWYGASHTLSGWTWQSGQCCKQHYKNGIEIFCNLSARLLPPHHVAPKGARHRSCTPIRRPVGASGMVSLWPNRAESSMTRVSPDYFPLHLHTPIHWERQLWAKQFEASSLCWKNTSLTDTIFSPCTQWHSWVSPERRTMTGDRTYILWWPGWRRSSPSRHGGPFSIQLDHLHCESRLCLLQHFCDGGRPYQSIKERQPFSTLQLLTSK